MKSAAHLLFGVLLASFAVASPAAQDVAAKPDIAQGEAKSNAVCGACHTNDGSRGSPANPILQGQHPAYMVKQLTEFKAGKRQSPVMQGMAASLTPQDMRNVAAFYATKHAKPGFAKSTELATLGQKIYRGGIVDRQIPACAGCHSPDGAGIPSQYPRLAGQHSEYVEAQLNAFRSGARTNSPQMTDIAHEMTDTEIKSLADYIAGLR